MKLIWDKVSERLYETGVRMGVLYPQNPATGLYPLGVAWNGLTGVTESPSGAESNKKYADDGVYLNLLSAEEFGATVEAYTYPDEFGPCDGSAEPTSGVYLNQQKRQAFGLCYRTVLGNDTEGEDYGYKLHLVYGAKAAPSEKAYGTINESPDAITFSWELSTTPVPVANHRPVATLTINSTKVDPAKLAILEDILYGTAGADPRLPMPDEVISIMEDAAPAALALSSIVPADGAAGVATNAAIVLTFNAMILREAVVVMSEIGELIAGTKTWDVTGKILTFTPTVALAGATVYLVAVGGVVDIYGRVLAPEAKNFETI